MCRATAKNTWSTMCTLVVSADSDTIRACPRSATARRDRVNSSATSASPVTTSFTDPPPALRSDPGGHERSVKEDAPVQLSLPRLCHSRQGARAAGSRAGMPTQHPTGLGRRYATGVQQIQVAGELRAGVVALLAGQQRQHLS